MTGPGTEEHDFVVKDKNKKQGQGLPQIDALIMFHLFPR